jgi:adenylate cyclase
MEIERKFLVVARPDLEATEGWEVEQGYLAIPDGERSAEVRLRLVGDEQWLTVKGGRGRERIEKEIALEGETFDALWPLTEGRRVEKTRYVFPHGELDIELDVYKGELDGLLTAEVEFPDEETADDFDPPDWFGEEVTGDERYLNATLATEGLPR